MLLVKLLEPGATLPTVAHPGEDLGYDVYSLNQVWLYRGKMERVRTGIAVAAYEVHMKHTPLGLILKDRSSMAGKGVHTHGGVIDAGYRGEIMVSMTTINQLPYMIEAGAKIAQMVPVPVLTGKVLETDDLGGSKRGQKGFGSSGN
jgi:dUTP diphosphatase